ncbi:hypothetical protein TSAR_014788 [Trichomalopsis sarcophagae]|uniref:Uncharacterized protein n=1 Tax=Trichomalopsis sarcophagae TaxID=543379 RepID=A0A232EKZ3_9HYME|nr:hypothetical protein TSAR_014788 [Trichomalopsis sarcophagae]
MAARLHRTGRPCVYSKEEPKLTGLTRCNSERQLRDFLHLGHHTESLKVRKQFKFSYGNLTQGKLWKTSHDSTLPTQCMKVQSNMCIARIEVSEESCNLRVGELKMVPG